MIMIYITNQEFQSKSICFTARLAQANLADKNDIANFLKIQILIID